MGILSWLKFGTEDDYELVLASLDEEIKNVEINLREYKIKKSKYNYYLVGLCTSLYLVYLVYYFGLKVNGKDENWWISVLSFMPVVVSPILTYLVSLISNYIFNRLIVSNTEYVNVLKAKQKQKVEALKKKMNYDKTKNLLDRYDEDAKKQINLTKNMVPNPNFKGNPQPRLNQGPSTVNNQNAPNNGLKKFASSTTLREKSKEQEVLSPNSEANRAWYDKLVDAIVGDEQSELAQFALICHHCHAHNGLVTANDYENMRYNCPKCHQLNISRRELRKQLNPSESNSTENLLRSPGSTQQKLMARSMNPTNQKLRQSLPQNFLGPKSTSQQVHALDLTSRATSYRSDDENDEEKESLETNQPSSSTDFNNYTKETKTKDDVKNVDENVKDDKEKEADQMNESSSSLSSSVRYRTRSVVKKEESRI